MVKRKIYAIAFLICSLFVFQACKGEGPTTLNLSKSPENKPTEIKPIPETFNSILIGNVGDYPVRMELNRNENGFWGQYKYSNKAEADYLSIDGSIDSNSILKLKESERDGSETGTFEGKFTNAVFGNKTTLKYDGNWTNTKTGKSLPFNLAEYRPDVGENLQVETKEIKEQNKSIKSSINVSFPQIAGSSTPLVEQFNKYVNNYVQSQIKDFNSTAAKDMKEFSAKERADMPQYSFDGSYKPLYSDGKLLSLQYTTSVFTGGAHPISAIKSINYDLAKGAPLTLANLFLSNSNYLVKISDYCIPVLIKRKVSDDTWVKEGAAPKANNYDTWNIMDIGLSITFDSYQVAPYAAGPQEVIVPYSVLGSVINPNGPLAKFKK